VFITRNYVPNAFLEDSVFVMPTTVDNFSKSVIMPSDNTTKTEDVPIDLDGLEQPNTDNLPPTIEGNDSTAP